MKFIKMQSLGNDFVLIDAVKQSVESLQPSKIKLLCDRHLGIGCDQLLLLGSVRGSSADVHCKIYNADGQEVNQCGNGLRCVAGYAIKQGYGRPSSITLSTAVGQFTARMLNSHEVWIEMGQPKWLPHQVPFKASHAEKRYELKVNQQTYLAGIVGLGNPHVVLEVSEENNTSLEQLGQALNQGHSQFPEGANVSMMQIQRPDYVKLSVYERGVGITQACGSAACAAVAVGQSWGKLGKNVEVSFPKGHLKVSWEGGEKHLFLQGPIEYVFEGDWLID